MKKVELLFLPSLAVESLLLLAFAAGLGCSKAEDSVLASVGSTRITRSEFQRRLQDVAQEYQGYLMTPQGRRQFLNVLIREKLVLAAAQESPVSRSPEFKAELDRFRAEQEGRYQEYRDYLLSKMWIEALRSDGTIHVTDKEVEAYYRKHPREVMVRHILVSSPEEGKLLVQKLRAGASFKNLAQARSLDVETASRGGSVPPFLYGELLPELGEVAFQMRTGEIAGPVRSQFGYHIVRKDGERPVALDKARERLRRLLEKQKLDGYLEQMRTRYPVHIQEARL